MSTFPLAISFFIPPVEQGVVFVTNKAIPQRLKNLWGTVYQLCSLNFSTFFLIFLREMFTLSARLGRTMDVFICYYLLVRISTLYL